MSEQIDQMLGKRLRQRRRELGLTQHSVAQVVGVRFQQIHKYESGANSISAARLWRLARALQIPVTDLFVGIE